MASQNQPTPPSSTSSQNGASPDTQNFRVVRKRNRIPLSCAPCRHRKLKCNRGHPCDNCCKRGDTAQCNYASAGNRRKGSGGPNGTPDDMQNRIDRLEGLVLSLMGNDAQSGGPAAARAMINSSRSNSLSTGSQLDMEGADVIKEEMQGQNGEMTEESDVEQVSRGIGIMKVDNGRSVFASDAHWYAILGEISEVKQWWETHKEDYKKQMDKVQAAKASENPGTAFLLQGLPAKTHEELLAAFPSKVDADRLIARYFNAYDPSVHIIHGPSFQKQYDKHWMAPQESGPVWLGMCFAMMTLALQSYHRAGDEPPEYRGRAMDLSHEFRRLTAQCLLLGDITQPIAQILETLVLHVQAEYGRSRDAEPGVLLMTSLCVRLAMRMGYHRDPGPHPAITPFQGEIRRRVWTFVRQCDLLISFQFGMPSMIRTDHIDAEPPRNLYDDELHEDMKSLPPSRPSFEATPMSYMIAKSKMTFLFGSIVERTGSVINSPTYEETMRYDQELREARATHPPLLQMRSFQESARDPANLIMQRLGLELVYLRSLFVLHRKFIAKGRENPRFAYSRKTCIDASMEMLAHQATLHQESQPGGRLRSVKWYISSLTTHDFLLAAMLVCLDLYHQADFARKSRSSASPSSPPTDDVFTDSRREEMLKAVENCILIWDSVKEISMEAYKASMALKVMSEKLKMSFNLAQQPQQRPQQQQPNGAPPHIPRYERAVYGAFPNGNVTNLNNDDLPPEQSAAMTLGMLSSGGMSPGPSFGGMGMPNGQMGGGAEKPQSFPASMAGLLNEPVPDSAAGRTGLTPGYTGPDGGSGGPGGNLNGAASPFTQMFGQNGGNFMGMDGLGGDIDWGAWDNYIANNTAMDPGNMWSMNMDLESLGAPTANANGNAGFNGAGQGQGSGQGQDGGGGGSQQQQQQQQMPSSSGPGQVFMGATTPGAMGM